MNSSTVLLIILALFAGGATAAAVVYRRRVTYGNRDRRRLAEELNRRLSELFSLQELSYVLSESIQLPRIVEQVVRFAMRFLDARGALVALVREGANEPLTVAGADGVLAPLAGTDIPRAEESLVARSALSDRLSVVGRNGPPIRITGSLQAESAAAVPLRAHGVIVGTLVLVDPRDGALSQEDVRLLSTVATHAAVAIANARLFGLVRHGKEQWEATFDSMNEGLAVVDARGLVRRANRALADQLGITLPATVGERLCQALLGRPDALDAILTAARQGEHPAPVIERSARHDRSYRITAAGMPATDEDKDVVVLVEDVTEQQALEAQLIQSEKLATVGQLVSGVAHELNNPLTSVAGLTEFLLEQKELGPGDRGHLKVIHEQAERAGRIVRNLLTFARKGPAERTRVSLNEVVNRTLLLMSYDLKLRVVDTVPVLAEDLPDVTGDRHALQQVVLNLLNNAAQAVSENPEDHPRTIRLETWSDDMVHLRVSDSGPGLTEATRRSLFTPFFTTKAPGQGTGLGLSISYSIVQSHGGVIEAERPAAGAAFRIDLPPAPPGASLPRSSRETPAALPPAMARHAILLVDDDLAVRRLVQALFGREGHTVDVARSATHALELVGERPYDLILADAQTAADGKLFVEDLVERRPALASRLLVATGDVRPATEEKLQRMGVRYVRKPFNLRDLREEAARVWATLS